MATAALGTEFPVTNYGAKGDGHTLDTKAIQKAIDAAAAAHGTVVFKPGVYLSGGLFLKSGMQFRVDRGVTIRGVQDTSQYPEMPTRIAGVEMTWPSALINVYEQSNVKIFGNGIIDGNGKYWWDQYWALRKQYDSKGLRVNRPTEYVTIRDCTVRQGAAGFTVGSETSGGIHYVDVSGLHVLSGASAGILFKSARTRGGTVGHIRIHDVHLDGVRVAVGIGLNWNPRYSYAKIPPGIKNIPAYWRVLTEPVPPEKGLPHLRDVSISNLIATGARRAFSVSGYPNDLIDNFHFDHVNIAAQTAGTIADAANWTFTNSHIQTADDSRVKLKDCRNVTGLPGE